MKPLARIVLVLITALAVGGCAAGNLARLQSDFYALQERKQAGGKLKDWESGEEVAAAYASLARSAAEVADAEKDKRTAVAAWRLSAVAGWQAGPAADDTRRTAVAKGSALCASFGKNEWRPPRDCLLLAILPALVSFERAMDEVDALREAAGAGALAEAERERLKNLTLGYFKDPWGSLLAGERQGGGDDAAAVASLQAYLWETRRRVYCGKMKLHGLAGQKIPEISVGGRRVVEISKQHNDEMHRFYINAGQKVPEC